MIGQRKVVDSFIFNNELDLLEIRLHEMGPFVDWFVIVEGTKSFANKPKKLNFQDNKYRYADFIHKIIHVVVDDMPDTSDAWALEAFTRNATLRGVAQVPEIGPFDWVILSDVDEIIRALSIEIHEQVFEPGSVYKFDLSFRYYKFNCRAQSDGWSAPIMVANQFFTDPENTRHNRNPSVPWNNTVIVPAAGWHFSYMGGIESIRAKIDMNAHQEFNNDHFKDVKRLEQKLKYGEDLYDREAHKWEFINDYDYPKFVMDNRERFAGYFEPMPQYQFRCVIPFSGNYDHLRWAIETCYSEAIKFSTLDVPVVVFNNSGATFDASQVHGSTGHFTLVDLLEPLLLPNTLNWAIRQARANGDEFMMWMHDDAAIRCNGFKLIMDKYHQVKGSRWGMIFLGKDGDTCSLYNPEFNFTENVWYDPFLFPMYFMDCHYSRIMRLRGWTLEYANWDHPVDYVIHSGSHSLTDVPMLRRKNDLVQPEQRSLYRKIWGGDPGQETVNDPHANGTC